MGARALKLGVVGYTSGESGNAGGGAGDQSGETGESGAGSLMVRPCTWAVQPGFRTGSPELGRLMGIRAEGLESRR